MKMCGNLLILKGMINYYTLKAILSKALDNKIY